MIITHTYEQIINELGETRFISVDPDRCYRRINLPFDVKHFNADIEPYRQGVTSNRESILNFPNLWDSNFRSWLDSIGLKIEILRLFSNAPNYEYTRHVDRQDVNDQSAVLNFPFNDVGSTFSWYKLIKSSTLETRPNGNGHPVYRVNPSDCEEILNLEIQHDHNQPILLNTGYIHSVQVGNTSRYCFSYFLKEKNKNRTLQWDEAIEIFSPYISLS
jgi:hypothetical protein